MIKQFSKQIISIAIIIISAIILPLTALGAVEISDGSVKALYHLEDTADASGNGYNLTNNNSATFATGKLSNAGFVNKASSQYFSVNSDLGITGNISINGWVKITQAPSAEYYQLFNHRDSSGVWYYVLYTQESGTYKVKFIRSKWGVADEGITQTYTLTTDTWYMLTMTYDGANLRGYINGEIQGVPTSASGTGNATSDGFNLGANFTPGDYSRAGIDELSVFNTTISTTTINLLYNNGNGAEICVSVGCGGAGGGQTASGTTTIIYPQNNKGINILNLFFGFFSIVLSGIILYKL